MKKIILCVMIICITVSFTVYLSAAFNYNSIFYSTNGYRTTSTSAAIYFQNNLNNSSIYSNHLVTAVSYWNNAGLTDRTYVINTSSSSYIYNESFSDSPDPSIQEEGMNGTVAFYEPLFQNNTYCSCHRTRSFLIALNDDSFGDMTTMYKRGVITHELGHALGLSDLDTEEGSNTYGNRSIMSYASDLETKATPYTFDVTNANEAWSPHS